MPFKTYSFDGISVSSYNFEQFKYFLEASNDSTYVLNFWATWCAPCIAELPYFKQANKTFKESAIRFIYVSLDFENQIINKLLPFLKENKLEGEIIVLKQDGMNNWIGKIEKNWSGNIPATLIYDQSGRDFYPKNLTYDALQKAILKRIP